MGCGVLPIQPERVEATGEVSSAGFRRHGVGIPPAVQEDAGPIPPCLDVPEVQR